MRYQHPQDRCGPQQVQLQIPLSHIDDFRSMLRWRRRIGKQALVEAREPVKEARILCLRLLLLQSRSVQESVTYVCAKVPELQESESTALAQKGFDRAEPVSYAVPPALSL